MISFRHYVSLHLAVLVAGVLVACVATPAGAVRLGAEIGAGLSAVVGALAMTLGAKALTGTFQQSLAALVAFFLLRMVTVAAALLLAKVAGGSLLAAAMAFFGLYLAGQALELTYVSGQWRAARVGENRA